jgi:hypothetical protein
MAKTIGQLIEEEVRRQGRNITAFADEICCTRTNVYDIFQRNKMDVAQLQLISKVLNHNFFKDLADDPALAGATNPEVEKDLMNRRAIAQFFDAMPKVIKAMHLKTSIVMTFLDDEIGGPLPDYALSEFVIFFTIGERLYDRFDEEKLRLFDVTTDTIKCNQHIDIWRSKISRQWFIDIMLDYKTEQEWSDIMAYIFTKYNPDISVQIS